MHAPAAVQQRGDAVRLGAAAPAPWPVRPLHSRVLSRFCKGVLEVQMLTALRSLSEEIYNKTLSHTTLYVGTGQV